MGQLIGWLLVPVMNANLDVILRSTIPVEMQGRVYACRNTLQFFTIPIGFSLEDGLWTEFANLSWRLRRPMAVDVPVWKRERFRRSCDDVFSGNFRDSDLSCVRQTSPPVSFF